MSETKSKSIEFIEQCAKDYKRNDIPMQQAMIAVIISETEAEQRCKQQLQELRDRITNLSICDIDSPVFTHTREFRSNFDYIKKCFIEKLTEKQ